LGQDAAILLLLLVTVGGLGWYFAGRLSLSYEGIEQGRLRAEASRAEAERLRQREAFLADASRGLSASLDYETTLSTVARLAVPTIADWCAVDVLDDNGSARRLVVTHEDPAK